MANSMFNPFVYYWMNARFRGYFRTVMSSIYMLCCAPARLLFRSHSASSLDIGVVPIDRRRGVVRRDDGVGQRLGVDGGRVLDEGIVVRLGIHRR